MQAKMQIVAKYIYKKTCIMLIIRAVGPVFVTQEKENTKVT